MYTKVLMKHNEELFYDYIQLGYDISITPVNNGLMIYLSGLSDDYIIQQILTKIIEGTNV